MTQRGAGGLKERKEDLPEPQKGEDKLVDNWRLLLRIRQEKDFKENK